MMNTQMPASPGSSPRLPSPPPFTEVQIGPKSPSFVDPALAIKRLTNQENGDADASRRIRPGTKAKDMSAGPPLTTLGELDSAFQLQEHLMALYRMHTHPPDSDTTVAITPSTAYLLANAPQGVETWLWLYELTRLLTVKLNIIIVAFFNDSPPCSAATCPEMRASEWQYLCAVHDPPKSCCAIDYCCHTLDHAASILTSNKYFPSRLSISEGGPSSGKSQGERHISSIFRRLYRIFAHAWFQHRSVFWEVEGEHGLYVLFKTVSDHYHLIPPDNYTIPAEAFGPYLPGSSEGDSQPTSSLNSSGQQQTWQLPFRMLSKDSKGRELENKSKHTELGQPQSLDKSDITAKEGEGAGAGAGTQDENDDEASGTRPSKTTRRTKQHIKTDVPLAVDDVKSAKYMPIRESPQKKDFDKKETTPVALVSGSGGIPTPATSRPPAEKTKLAPFSGTSRAGTVADSEKPDTEAGSSKAAHTSEKDGSKNLEEAKDVKAAGTTNGKSATETKDFVGEEDNTKTDSISKPVVGVGAGVEDKEVSSLDKNSSTPTSTSAPASAEETSQAAVESDKVEVVDLTADEATDAPSEDKKEKDSEKKEKKDSVIDKAKEVAAAAATALSGAKPRDEKEETEKEKEKDKVKESSASTTVAEDKDKTK